MADAPEAVINGDPTFSELRDLVSGALAARFQTATGVSYCYAHIADMTADQVVYSIGGDDLYQCDYSVDGSRSVSLGEPIQVVRTYAPAGDSTVGEEPPEQAPMAEADTDAEHVVESDERDRLVGRVIEARGKNAQGGRIYRVRVIRYGESKNRRNYSEAVLRAAAHLYEGSKAYDHHRSAEELHSSTIRGLSGVFHNAAAESDGIYADLHLFPSAGHVAEALDASLAVQDKGLEPLVGVSHDVQAHFRTVNSGGRLLKEAVAITRVHSADIVAEPAAGGRATRALAAIDPTDTATHDEATEESMTPDELANLLRALTPEQLADAGLKVTTEATETETETVSEATEATPEEKPTGEPKTSFLANLMIRTKVQGAGLPDTVIEGITAALPDRIVESDVDTQIAGFKAVLATAERAGLTPQVAAVQVTGDERDKKTKALDAFFAGNFSEGYYSFRQAFVDFTGRQPRSFDEDFNRVILRESFGADGFDSRAERSSESLVSSTWNLVLGDSITRRMVSSYGYPNLQTWRQIVSSVVPINDFRTQRIDRVGGYGTLPIVNEGQPYQPLTSPTNEEVTYSLSKRGGTEDLTLEMIANDDVRAISNIPTKLGRAAAQTLFRFVWDFLRTNPTVYDSVALFHASHNNTASAALSGSALSTVRASMRAQTAYGDSVEVLGFTPRTLVVPSQLEEIAFELSNSAVALPSAAPVGAASNIPNLHAGTNYVVVDYFGAGSATGWYVIADPNQCPTMEVGFYQGRETPDLFTQSDPNTGTMFNADKFTYKIRHIYSGAILDWRAFQRGNS
jgi:hypothetical protein